MPLHSVTASALLKSLLSSEVGQWGSLSEGTDQLPLTFIAFSSFSQVAFFKIFGRS